MAKVNVYLNFEGNCEQAFNFYRSVFGGEFKTFMRFKDLPMPGMTMDEHEQNMLMHVALPVGKEDILMGSDTPKTVKVSPGNNVRISLTPETMDEAERLFEALSAGGKVGMPLAKQVWGDFYGDFEDKFGIFWMVDYAYPKPETGAELMSAAKATK